MEPREKLVQNNNKKDGHHPDCWVMEVGERRRQPSHHTDRELGVEPVTVHHRMRRGVGGGVCETVVCPLAAPLPSLPNDEGWC